MSPYLILKYSTKHAFPLPHLTTSPRRDAADIHVHGKLLVAQSQQHNTGDALSSQTVKAGEKVVGLFGGQLTRPLQRQKLPRVDALVAWGLEAGTFRRLWRREIALALVAAGRCTRT